MRFKKASFFLLLFILAFSAKSQIHVEGIVLDQLSNQHLDQIHVLNISNKQEVISNAKGEFKIIASINDLLVFRSLGYNSDTVLVTSIKPLKHYMKAARYNLESVNVNNRVNYREEYAQTFNKANPTLLKPGRGFLFYPSSYFSKEGKNARRFVRMIKKERYEVAIYKRFNIKTITALLPIKQPELDAFIVRYKPSYAFVIKATTEEFNYYLMDAYHKFKKLPADKKKLLSLKIK
ncbi:MAG: hypothetical protein EOP00_00220 [Pedobacter sp.]|nr:MAG: hypothetical protein EOP00_00220 [Pedobacter sp.]